MKNFIVDFTEESPRIVKSEQEIEQLKDNPLALLNPDISHLVGISPSYWVIDGDKIVSNASTDRPAPHLSRARAKLQSDELNIKYDFETNISELRDHITGREEASIEATKLNQRILLEEISLKCLEVEIRIIKEKKELMKLIVAVALIVALFDLLLNTL